MPNWVENSVTIKSSEEDISQIITQLSVEQPSKDTESKISFMNIVSPPEDYMNTYNEGSNWYMWNVEHWGTKWDTCEPHYFSSSSTSVTYGFQTAWSPPIPVFQKLSEQYPNAKITLEWEEEQGFGGEEEFLGGTHTMLSSWDIPSSHSDYEARDKDCPCNWSDEPDDWFEDCPTNEERVTCQCGSCG